MSAPEIRITDPRAPVPGLATTVRAYVALVKPRIIELLLVTTVPAMVLAAGEWPGTGLVLATILGGTLSAGGANAINNVLDRDIDAVMKRTARRPLPTHRVEPVPAAVFGTVLGLAGFVWLWLAVNLLAAALATGALLFYVLVYSLLLKRTTTQNIVIGGAAGAVPALVGWAAVTGELSLSAWLLFAVVFYWTPPHFWALSLRYRDDYARAGVPMLPVVAGERVTLRHIFLYSILVVGISLVLHPVADLGALYLTVALVLGAGLLLAAWRLRSRVETAMSFFQYSNVYLALLFAAVAADVLIR